MSRYFFAFVFTVCFCGALCAQSKTDSLLLGILNASKDPILQKIVANPGPFRCQIIYTQINRDRKNKPSFHNYYFNYDPANYYYPASTVKLPLAALALEKLKGLQGKGIDKHTTVVFDSSYSGQKALYADSTAATGLPSIGQFIRRALLISENDPYNRLYQFVGQQQINRSLHKKGYNRSRITRQFMGFNEDQNRHTNGLRFLGPDDRVLWHQPPAYNTDSFAFDQTFHVGKGYINRTDSLVHAPYDFTRHNYLPLEDLQQLLQSIVFPESVPAKQRFKITKDDHSFLLRYLSQYPSETPYPKYDSSKFYDSYVKFFFQDSTHRMPAGVRVFNKVGWAYGFLTDVAYVADFNNGIEYMLTATVYVNSDEVLNDDKYEYETIGMPFFIQLGKIIYQYEQQRPRRFKPNLSVLKIDYEKRDAADKRPVIKEADN